MVLITLVVILLVDLVEQVAEVTVLGFLEDHLPPEPLTPEAVVAVVLRLQLFKMARQAVQA